MVSSQRLLDHWMPPEGAGQPHACLATTFTFDADFFEISCLARFLALTTQRGEGDDLEALLEREERLAETTVTVLADRSDAPGSRSLRWDVLSVAAPGGLLHAKAALLVWERTVRFIVGSANLTPAGYRRQAELAVTLDAREGGQIPRPLFSDLVDALRELVTLVPGRDDIGPKRRAHATLDLADRTIDTFGLPAAPRRADPRIAIVPTSPGRPALPRLDDVWQGGRPRCATVLSPFFDTDGNSPAVGALTQLLGQRGEATARFVLPVDPVAERVTVRAPAAILQAIPGRIRADVRAFADPSPGEPRRLHAKAVVVESESWVAALVGSSNFTEQGLGLLDRRGHHELNLAIGAATDSETGRWLTGLVPAGDPIPDDADWEPEPPDDELAKPPLPAGFADALVDPPRTLLLTFDRYALPSAWEVALPEGVPLVGSDQRTVDDSDAADAARIVLADGTQIPFWLTVTWSEGCQQYTAAWPVNVTDPAALPPPDELRDLPVSALLDALASFRPLPAAIAEQLHRLRTAQERGAGAELDPLRRYAGTPGLLHRTRRLSAALEGVLRRFHRPVASLDALRWRLEGPLGPVAIADGLAREQQAGRLLEGEVEFALCELALELSRVDRDRLVSPAVPREAVEEHLERVVAALVARIQLDERSPVARYVRAAIAAAMR